MQNNIEEKIEKLKVRAILRLFPICILFISTPFFFELEVYLAEIRGLITHKEISKVSPASRGSAGKYLYHLTFKIDSSDKTFTIYDDNIQDTINKYDYLLEIDQPITIVFDSVNQPHKVYSMLYGGENTEIAIYSKGWVWYPITFSIIFMMLISYSTFQKRKRKLLEEEQFNSPKNG